MPPVRTRPALLWAGAVALAGVLIGCGAMDPLGPAAGQVAASTSTAAATSSVSADAAGEATQAPASAWTGLWQEAPTVAGVDVSRYQEEVDWAGLVASGHRFAYVKSTEGSGHVSPTHEEQRADARAAGLLQGAYHYARPGQSSGTLQARFFAANGGEWLPDGLTLPGALDLEPATEGEACYGLSPEQLATWVGEFSTEYERLTGRRPVLYVAADLWTMCLGDTTRFADHALWLFDHEGEPGPLPAGWERPTLWQHGVVDGIDRNVFLGTEDELRAWAGSRES